MSSKSALAAALSVTSLVSLVSLAPLAACSSDSGSSSGGTTSGTDAGTDSAPPVDPGTDASTDDAGGCTPVVNGEVNAPTGTVQVTISSSTANLSKPAPGTIPCAATFDPSGGVSLGNNQYTGSFNLTCYGAEGALYFGLRVGASTKPKTGDSYPVGLSGSVSSGGGFAWNGQSDLAWEEGPRCDSKMNQSKEWNGEVNAGSGGAFVVDTVTGTDMTFHVTETNLTVSTTGLNYTGTGAFKISGSGTVKVSGL